MKPIAPAAMPTQLRRASVAPSKAPVIARLANATDGAAANTPAYRLGDSVCARSAKVTTRQPPNTVFAATSATSSHSPTPHLQPPLARVVCSDTRSSPERHFGDSRSSGVERTGGFHRPTEGRGEGGVQFLD